MNALQTQQHIQQALQNFHTATLAHNALHLLKTIGYASDGIADLESNQPEAFLNAFEQDKTLNRERAMVTDWETIDFLFQLTDEEITETTQMQFVLEETPWDNTRIETYLFFAIKLKNDNYTRTQLATITREINKLTPMPAMIIFQHGQNLTFAVINRRLHKQDDTKDVLEKVTLIKDINTRNPHTAHIKILFDLSLNELFRIHEFNNFVEFHNAWAKTLDIQELNKQFYRELSNWYFWAVDNVEFPEDAGKDVAVRNATSVIRMITRLIFVWFIKEKHIIPDIFFNPREIQKILVSTAPEKSTYYKAILQNLFFATLNQEMNSSQKPNSRKFRGKNRQHYNITSLYRYEEYFKKPDEAIQHFQTIPFLNGGLFECLDKKDKDKPKKILRIDGFSDREDNSLSVPNFLFFSEEREVDLNKVYDTSGKRYKVRGLLEILRRYKFTITENTPIEEEVALDPELLGKVFENLLAAYNPETGATARKQTGSFYTPREIVNYMVDESLIAYLKDKLITYYESETTLQLNISGQPNPIQTGLDTQKTVRSEAQKSDIEKKLRHLTAYRDEQHQFNETETEHLINAIDTLKILDPACGSGAFPMGTLHKLVFILGKLDPRNDQWRQRQIAKVQNLINIAEEIDDNTVRRNTIRDLENEIQSINEAFNRNELDYGRKLYLIENAIYGVDIQPIAVQIAKLRFFISLIVDQRIDDTQANRGVRPLPNLETKFAAANTLIGVEKPEQGKLRNPVIDQKEEELTSVRRKHFTARTPRTKDKYREQDTQIRTEIATLLKDGGFPSETTEKIANWNPYDQNATADFFDPEWVFSITDGFNIVIGNPPYVQLQNENGRLGNLYQDKGFDTFARTGDIYCLFYEKANQLLKSNGHVCFITSNKWMRAGYGKKLRDYFIKHTQPIQLLDMGPDVFDATVDTNILLFQKIVSDAPTTFVGVSLGTDFDRQTGSIAQYLSNNGTTMEMPAKGEPWAILSPAELNLKRKIEDIGKPLKDWNINIYRGIVTGCNEAFIINEAKREQLIAQDPKSAEIIKPLLRGKDIKRYHAQQSGSYILATGYDLDIPNKYPAIYNHLEVIGEQIESGEIKTKGKGLFNRDDQGENWWNLRACAYYSEFDNEKIVYPETTHSANFFYDSGEFFLDKTCFMITRSDLKILVGLLSSTLMTFAYKRYCSGTVLGAKGYQYNKHALEKLPVAKIPASQQQSFITLVNQILAAKHTDPEADTSDLEDEIDKLIYDLYHLTPEEIAIIEQSKPDRKL